LTSLALTIALALGTLALADGKILTAALAFATAAALLAFLRYNFPPASIFLGDSGSMLVGMLLGVLALDSALEQPAARLALAAPLTLLTLPILDTACAIVRRKLTGRSLYCTDRGHLHHCLLRRFGEPRRVLLVVATCNALLLAAVFLGRRLNSEWLLVATSLAVVVALSLSRLFGHVELRMLGQRLASLAASWLRRPTADQPRQLEMRLQGTVDWRELWQRLIRGEPSLNLCRLRLDVNAPAMGEGYHVSWDRGSQADDHEGEDERWHAQVPLAVQGRTIGALEISGRRDGVSLGDTLAVLARLVHDFEHNACQLVAEATPPLSRLPAAKAVPRPGPALQRVSL
jgi:UDP-GlcNAc:undecaprenyl-phosphate GlcNAc-1-phosphate transferase